jgi:hypothetical protein
MLENMLTTSLHLLYAFKKKTIIRLARSLGQGSNINYWHVFFMIKIILNKMKQNEVWYFYF